LVLNCLMKYGQELPPTAFNFLVYTVGIGGTIALSALSYRFYERPFLQLKTKHTVISSGTI
ncbi:MAG: hypothetical protein K2Z81_14410, partial [Cyanobacteria bacterium]|nr:hypothetical protein [Cyanobacteriota bacterium]